MSIALSGRKIFCNFLGIIVGRTVLCGFSMETENMLRIREPSWKKHVDMIVANNLKQAGAGFGTDTNVVTLITKDDSRELPIMSKEDVARHIIDTILEITEK